MFEGVATAHTCAHPTSNACTSLRRYCNTTHLSQSSSHGSVHPHFAGNVHSSVRVSGIEIEGSCPTACATSPMSVGRDRSFRDWSVHQDRSQRWVCPHGPALASIGQQAPAHTQGRESGGGNIWNFGYREAAKIFKNGTDTLGLSGMTMYQPLHSEASIERVRGFRSAKARLVVQQCHKIRQKQSPGCRLPHSPSPVPKQVGNSRATCRGVTDKNDSKSSRSRMTGKCEVDVFGGSGFLTKSDTSCRFAWLCARHEVWSQV